MATLESLLNSELLPSLELIRPLGTGSTAEVYLARDPALQRLVAIKVLRPQAAADPVARKRFEREARAAAGIAHPNVTVIHRVGRLSNELPYIVMEYVDGRTLREVVEVRGALELPEARALLASVASALAAAHERGIVHRDVRPENIFVENRTGRAVLADFGLAALLETGSAAATRLTATGVSVGEPVHMSPERIRGEPLTTQSDVYALGILAYEVLTGRGPFAAASIPEILAAHMRQEPLPLRSLRPEADPRMAALIERCLAKDPARRPMAREVAAALAPTANAPVASADGRIGQFLEEIKRRRVYRVLAGYTVFGLAVFGLAQTIFDAFDLPRWSYRLTVAGTLAGLPVVVILAWLYDITATGIRRTRSPSASAERSWSGLKWLGLGASILVAVLLAWLFLRQG